MADPIFAEFEPADATGVIDTFRSVYGDEYPVPMVYEADYWIKDNEGEGLYTYVSRTDSGQVTGLVSFYRTAPFLGHYEFGQLAVKPEFRRGHLGQSLLQFAMTRFSQVPAAAGGFTEAGCHWTVSQRMVAQLGYLETAFAPALLGPETYAKEHDVTRRISLIMAYYSFRDRPHRLHIPRPFRDLIMWIYQDLGLEREFVHQEQPLEGVSRLTPTFLEGPRISRIDVAAPGADFDRCFTELESDHVQREAVVYQVRLPLEDPRTPAAAAILQRRGYGCCGVLPRWFDGDGLLLQRNVEAGDLSGFRVPTPRAQELGDRICAAWQS